MKLGRWLLVLFSCALAMAEPQPVARVKLPEFALAMEQLRGRVAELSSKPDAAVALAAELPPRWQVEGGGKEIEVSAAPLHDALEEFLKSAPKERPAKIRQLDERFALLAKQAEAYQSAAPIGPELHPRLERILAAREFAALRGPTQLQLLWQRIQAWLEEQLKKVFRRMPSSEESGPVFAWMVITVVCCVFGVWLYRRSREVEMQLTREVIPFAPGTRGWHAWLAEARSSAARGEWRDAIHCAFWAGVGKLESEGVWLPDRARTPREYLRAIPEWNAARPAFQSVMRSFERSWYGGLATSSDDFEQVLLALERMGCR